MTCKLHQLDLPARAPEQGSRFWRSFEELSGSGEFQSLLEREFPSQLAVWDDPVGRRNFLRLMAASFGLAGAVGCARPPVETIVPYVKQPELIVQGEPLYFASAAPRSGYGLGVLVESHMGRPTKIEGNPHHPASLGSTDPFTQAAVLGLYDPDRSQTVMRRGVIDTWDHFLTSLKETMSGLRARRGAGLRILTETITSPTLLGQVNRLLDVLPDARWYAYQPAGLDNVRLGARQAFSRSLEPIYRFDQADVVLALDCDFLLTLPGSVRYARDFTDRRRVREKPEMNRLYVAECTATITGAIADHRLPLATSALRRAALAIARRLGVRVPDASEEALDERWLSAVVSDLESHRGSSLVIAGEGLPPEMHALVAAMNDRLQNHGSTIQWIEPVDGTAGEQVGTLAELVDELNGGAVELLVMLGGNPVYNAPGELKFADALAKARQRVHLSDYYDETSFLCEWHIPAAHWLESWGDIRAFDGTATIQQPLIAPLYGGKTTHEVVAAITGQSDRSAYQLVQAQWQREFGDDFGSQWRHAVHNGVVPETRAATVDVELADLDFSSLVASAASEGTLEIEIRPDPTVWDGSLANNGWLQELPKPLSKITWDNVAYLSAATAERLGVRSEDVLTITVGNRAIQAPAWILPGQPHDCISLTLGYGRERAGRVGNRIGYNAYALLDRNGALQTSAQIAKAGRTHGLAVTQNHHSMDGRDIVRVTTLDRLTSGQSETAADKHEVEQLPSLYPDYDYGESPNAWGMVIDQTACIGCNACVVACQAENNSPVVGKEQVRVGREMQWLRIDRYYHSAEGDEHDLLAATVNPETYFQPMACVHCEKAPCEVVCPVEATLHDSEGTNNMVYNRCVGTRYCSNNCPYKVRRFNYLQYTDQETPVLKLLRNPDVTVRSRGVMEKCTYCIQRISAGRITSKKEGRAIADGEVVTACQQVCPTRAIVFGNLNDRKAEVRQLKSSPLNYGVLADLNTQPRTTYLARVVNPHDDLPPPSAAERKVDTPQQGATHS
jgi:molybdopterin-containing oxidoreductase family iron-sulfur binding subunit